LTDLLLSCKETDVVLADTWTGAYQIQDAITPGKNGISLKNSERCGETLFVLDDLFVWYLSQGQRVVNTIGVENLVIGPQLPFKYFESYYAIAENLPISEDERDKIRAGNILSLTAE
jgi:hypothetical protein